LPGNLLSAATSKKRIAAVPRATQAAPNGSGVGVAKRTSSRNHAPSLARPVPGSMRVKLTDWNGTLDCTPKKLGFENEKAKLISKVVVAASMFTLEAENSRSESRQGKKV
jgi:hypothetical protein